MSYTRFAQLLEHVIGLSAATIGPSAISRAVDARRRDHGNCNPDAYWMLLQRSSQELQQLVEAVVVPETWFFRNAQAFDAMVQDVLLPKLRADPMAQVRLLSLPCSSGEEAYTMAMALIDAGIPASRFCIEAIDISQQAIDQARAGVYGRNSFRGQDLAFRDRYFRPAARGWALRDDVRATVRFSQGNIFSPDFLAQALGFDVIFCRNLLIYFDPIRQKQAIAVLGRVLKDDGTLFVGHSEAGLMRSEGFASAGLAMAFAFQKTVAQPALGEPKAQLAAFIPASRHRTPAPPLRRMMVTPAARRDRQSPAIATRNVSPPDLRTLRRMADDGRLDEAERGCHAHIRAKGASADALLLLALISDASGQGKVAAHYYRKALYLDPDNVEALGHLALLLRREGDHVGAQRLDDRLRRRDDRKNV